MIVTIRIAGTIAAQGDFVCVNQNGTVTVADGKRRYTGWRL